MRLPVGLRVGFRCNKGKQLLWLDGRAIALEDAEDAAQSGKVSMSGLAPANGRK